MLCGTKARNGRARPARVAQRERERVDAAATNLLLQAEEKKGKRKNVEVFKHLMSLALRNNGAVQQKRVGKGEVQSTAGKHIPKGNVHNK